MIARREPIYLQAADHVVDAAGLPGAVVDRCLGALGILPG